MFSEIMGHPDLYGIVRSACCENDVGIRFATELLDANSGPSEERVLVLKLDHYYSSDRMHNPPPAIDCLILVRCTEPSVYRMYLVELRNTKRTAGVRPRDIQPKFETAITDFIEDKFRHIFLSEKYHISHVELLLVTDPLNAIKKNLTDEQARKLYQGTVIDAYSMIPPIRALGRILQIKPLLPDPAISGC